MHLNCPVFQRLRVGPMVDMAPAEINPARSRGIPCSGIRGPARNNGRRGLVPGASPAAHKRVHRYPWGRRRRHFPSVHAERKGSLQLRRARLLAVLDGAPDAQGAAERLRVVWSSVAETFTADNAAYGVANLLAAGGATGAIEAQQLLEILIEGPGGSDWQDRDRLLSELGVRVTYDYGDAWEARARAAIVNHILRLQCTPGRIGFWTFEDHIRLDTGDRCGTLSGDPLVDRINGLSIFWRDAGGV